MQIKQQLYLAREKKERYALYHTSERSAIAQKVANKWLLERQEKFEKLLDKLQFIETCLIIERISDGTWNYLRELVSKEAEDYLDAIEADPIGWARTYSQYFEGPHTHVPFHVSGWSIPSGRNLVDAHIELLIVKAENMLALAKLNNTNDENERKQQEKFQAEISRCLENAGLNKQDSQFSYFPIFQALNIVRKITACDYCRLTKSPLLCNSPSEIMSQVQIAKSIPSGDIYFAALMADPGLEKASMFIDTLTQARNSAWRNLSTDEISQVLSTLEAA
jgi:hypothetical protein